MMSCGGRRVEWAAGESNCHNIHHLTHVVASDWRWYKTLEHVRQTKACRNLLYTFNLYLPIFCNIVLERSPLPFCLKLFARGTYVGSLVIDSMSMGLGLSGALGAGSSVSVFSAHRV